MNTTIESLKFVRVVVGFVRAGVIVQPALSARAAQIVEQFKKRDGQGEDAPIDLARTADVLQVFRSSILPSQAACSESMTEIDAVLAPLRDAQRAADALSRAQTQAQAVDSTSPPQGESAAERVRERG